MNRVRALFLAFLLWPITSACAQDWADLHGRFTFDGKIPARKELPVSDKEKSFAGLPADFKLYDESLLVDEKTKGVANIVIWVLPDPAKSDAKMPIHPSYEKAPPGHQIVIKDLAYSPRVSVMRTDAKKLVFLDEGSVAHSPKIDSSDYQPYGHTPPVGPRDEWPIKNQTRLPMQISCSIHPQEKAYVLVRDNPYFAVTNAQGEFTIKNLPVGKWTFQFWHERCGYITDVAQGVKQTKWPKGRVEVEIHHSGVELGEIAVSDKNLKN